MTRSNMTSNERALVGALFMILMMATTWLMITVSDNRPRVAVLEQQMLDMRLDMKEHRTRTEKKHGDEYR